MLRIAFEFVLIVLSFLAGCKYKDWCYREIAIAFAIAKARLEQQYEEMKSKV